MKLPGQPPPGLPARRYSTFHVAMPAAVNAAARGRSNSNVVMLKAHDITQLIDVRTIPRSRHNPQYNRENLEPNLRDAGIRYEHVKALGGLRHPRKDSPNRGWRNESFRGYADYMQTPDFAS